LGWERVYFLKKRINRKCLFLTEDLKGLHKDHRGWKKIKLLMKKPVIVDGRNVYTPKEIRKEGFTYMSIGRK